MKEDPVGQASRLSENYRKRHLPHFEISGSYYFITFKTYNSQLLSTQDKDYVYNAIKFLDNKRYELYAFVILDNHVHIIIKPNDTLSKIMHSIKSFTAHEINKIRSKNGKLWQNENYDRLIRNESELKEKINYIINNPIKINLVIRYEEYKWLYVKGWINDNL